LYLFRFWYVDTGDNGVAVLKHPGISSDAPLVCTGIVSRFNRICRKISQESSAGIGDTPNSLQGELNIKSSF
jgi:hypothetical protein